VEPTKIPQKTRRTTAWKSVAKQQSQSTLDALKRLDEAVGRADRAEIVTAHYRSSLKILVRANLVSVTLCAAWLAYRMWP
jgi:hypothetical protein